MKIPDIRVELTKLADALVDTAEANPAVADILLKSAELVIDLREETYRRRKPRRPNASKRMTAQMKRRIHDAWFENPTAMMQTIAEGLGVNAGRVYETIYGFRR